MKNSQVSKQEWMERIVLGVVFMALGSLIMMVFNPWELQLSRMNDYLGRIGLIVFLVAVFALVQRSAHFGKYSAIIYGLLILTIAFSLDRILGIYLIEYLGVTDHTPAGWAIPKLQECIVVVGVVILFTRMAGNSLGSIYIQKGNLRLGLTIGLLTFSLAAAGSIPMATLFQAQNLSIERIIPWIPWVLIFVLANASMEEILFRGLFLRKLDPFFGKWIPNLMIAIVFTLMHRLANYTSDQVIFLAVLFPLALAWGYLMQKTDAVWASILFHAGMDIPIILGIFSNL
jgi:membrane protease YdiL (CAAX protease family)